MAPYALTIFVSAFLLFQIQPLIGKYILPWYGGSPGVWTACQLFFQVVLLAGYAYSHLISTWLKPKAQARAHIALLVVVLLLLPITPSDGWRAGVEGDPTAQILLLLSASVGLPYFILSSTAPLMQRWLSLTHPGAPPYRLYALSNAGALLALLSYPLYFEREFSRRTQASLWSGAVVVFVVCCAYCAWHAGGKAASEGFDWRTHRKVLAASAPASAFDRGLWIVLPAIASILLLATTNTLCQEVAVVPLLWVLPLSLYLLSFILCFDHPRWYRRGVFAAIGALGIASVIYSMRMRTKVDLGVQIVIYCGTLFAGCMICHGELYRVKPGARSLTGYFLGIAAGGALGGFLVSVVAPWVFDEYRELPIGLVALTCVLGVVCLRERARALAPDAGVGGPLSNVGLSTLMCATTQGRSPWRAYAGGSIFMVAVAIGAYAVLGTPKDPGRRVVSASRNFYGTLKTIEHNAGDARNHYFVMLSGATTHGLQRTSFPELMWPTTYYGETSGVGRAIRHLPIPPGHRRFGLVGLGTGTLASYGKEGDYMRVYEINPAVRSLATSRFRYIASSPAKVDIVMGDARISLEGELARGDAQQFDLLALDAFSADAIPIHLLTKEAMVVYRRHLKPDGVLAIHTSNRYLDLVPIVEGLAQDANMASSVISDAGNGDWWINSSTWILLTTNTALLNDDDIRSATEAEVDRRSAAVWTDERASLLEVLR